MSHKDELKREYREHLREGRTDKATEAWNKLRSDAETTSENEEVSESEDFSEISGVGDELANELAQDYDTFEDLADASLEDLEPIPGIGSKRAESILEQVRE